MDMPTIARKRKKLHEIGTPDLTMKQAMDIFGVLTPAPIRRMIETGKISADKATGEWCIDAASVDRYLTKVNETYNREFLNS